MSVLSQTWQAYNDSDNEKPLVGTVSAVGMTLTVFIGATPASTPSLELTPTISDETITMLMTRTQTNTLTGSAYKGGMFYWALRDMEANSVRPLAAGYLFVNVVNTD